MPVDYIKSTPYLMSFMRDYQLKQRVERYFGKHPQELNKIRKDTFWLKRSVIDHYDRIPWLENWRRRIRTGKSITSTAGTGGIPLPG